MSILFAFGFTVAALLATIVVDASSLYLERRVMQAQVDLAALQAARDPASAQVIVRAALSEAGLLGDGADLDVVTGRYEPNPELLPDDRFSPGAPPHNAVSVSLRRTGRLFFAQGLARPPALAARGLASVTPEVSFSVGSRLASLNGGLANAVLSQISGTSLSLSVLDYQSLAQARVGALAFLDALAQTLSITAGSYDDVLSADATTGDIARALASVSNGAAKTVLNTLARDGAGQKLALGDLFDLGRLGALDVGSGDSQLDIKVSALDLLTAAVGLAEGTRQASVNLGANVPGLSSLTLDLALGEPPQGGNWFALGAAGTAVRTRQLRLKMEAGLLGGPGLLGAGVHLPVWLELAPSEAQLESATCPSVLSPQGTARILVRPGALRLAIGAVTPGDIRAFGQPLPVRSARLVDALLLKISGSSLVEVAQTTPIPLQFSSTDISQSQPRTARTSTLISSLTGSLLEHLRLDISILGLGLSSPAAITQALHSLLAPLTPSLDLTIAGALSALGIRVGEADVRVYSVRCNTPVLVG